MRWPSYFTLGTRAVIAKNKKRHKKAKGQCVSQCALGPGHGPPALLKKSLKAGGFAVNLYNKVRF